MNTILYFSSPITSTKLKYCKVSPKRFRLKPGFVFLNRNGLKPHSYSKNELSLNFEMRSAEYTPALAGGHINQIPQLALAKRFQFSRMYLCAYIFDYVKIIFIK